MSAAFGSGSNAAADAFWAGTGRVAVRAEDDGKSVASIIDDCVHLKYGASSGAQP